MRLGSLWLRPWISFLWNETSQLSELQAGLEEPNCCNASLVAWSIASTKSVQGTGSDGALDGVTWVCILRSSVVLSSTRSRGPMSSEAGLNCFLSSRTTFWWSSEVTSESESRIMRGVLRSSAGWPGELVAPNWVAQPCFLWGPNYAIWTSKTVTRNIPMTPVRQWQRGSGLYRAAWVGLGKGGRLHSPNNPFA